MHSTVIWEPSHLVRRLVAWPVSMLAHVSEEAAERGLSFNDLVEECVQQTEDIAAIRPVLDDTADPSDDSRADSDEAEVAERTLFWSDAADAKVSQMERILEGKYSPNWIIAACVRHSAHVKW
ncbi:hypothetical protein AB0F03_35295 [Streptomyces sp. NPDC028722]|uniref:hypothetical protein n=1 Tax=Streptomyces sp. NPDC028722 TaxID=3155016 RepID=UPI0033F2CDB5